MQAVNKEKPVAKTRATVYRYEEGFTVVSTLMWQAIRTGEISGDTLRVYAAMLEVTKRSNRFEGTQAALAAKLGMKASNMSRAFKALREAGFILRVREPGGMSFWYLDARRTFRGSADRHPAALDKQKTQREKDRKAKVVAISKAQSRSQEQRNECAT